MRSIGVSIACLAAAVGCAEDRVLQPAGDSDAAVIDGSDGGGPDDADAGGFSLACDMTGVWIVAQVTFSTALGADQRSVNWFYHDMSQTGSTFTIDNSLNCGFRVTGTTTVTLSDDTLEALALENSSSVGRQGTMARTGDGTRCDFDLDRTYNIRAANKAQFLTDHWQIGDPDKDLDTFPQLPADAAAGMEDWDADSHEGFTLSTGLGDRYVAQRDWNEHHGTVPKNANQFGGENIVVVAWDGQESVSDETSPFLRTGSDPQNPGYAYYRRVGDALVVVDTGDRPELETCKNVQRLALETWPDP